MPYQRQKEEEKTFLQARETEQLDQAEVVSGDQDSTAVVGVQRVDVTDVGVFGPDPTHLRPNHTSPGRPVDPFDLLFGA